jgi:hypothetical protein
MENENIEEVAAPEEVAAAVEVEVEEPIAIVEEPTPAPVEPEPMPEPVPVEEPQPQPAAANAAVTGSSDDVYLVKCVYENKYERKSLTIHHIQRRLEELGYKDVVGDRDGWLGELTMLSINQFQKDKGLDVTDKTVDEVTFISIFAGDPNVNIIA